MSKFLNRYLRLIASLLLFIFVQSLAFGQSTYKFKGIALNTDVDYFNRQLVAKGFTRINNLPSFTMHNGVLVNSNFSYAGYFFSDSPIKCYLSVVPSERTNKVRTVIVYFNPTVSIVDGTDDESFKYFVKLYAKKYGTPKISHILEETYPETFTLENIDSFSSKDYNKSSTVIATYSAGPNPKGIESLRIDSDGFLFQKYDSIEIEYSIDISYNTHQISKKQSVQERERKNYITITYRSASNDKRINRVDEL